MPTSIELAYKLGRANTLCNRIQEWLDIHHKGLLKATLSRRKDIMDEFEIFVGSRNIDRELLLEWNEHQEKKGLKASTINLKGRVIALFLNWCEANEFIERSPARFIVRHKVQANPLPQIYTEEEYELLKEASKGTDNYFFVVIGYRTGMSPVDMCHLRWSCINMEQLWIKTARIKMARHGPSAIFHMPILANSDLHLLLQEYKEAHTIRFNNSNDDYVHPELAGVYAFNRKKIRYDYQRLLNKVGIKGKTMKNLRNTFISNLANSEVNLALACKMSGHNDPSIFAAYVRPDMDSMRNALQKAFQWASNKVVKLLRKPEP